MMMGMICWMSVGGLLGEPCKVKFEEREQGNAPPPHCGIQVHEAGNSERVSRFYVNKDGGGMEEVCSR
jgi:hypothetical protein